MPVVTHAGLDTVRKATAMRCRCVGLRAQLWAARRSTRPRKQG